MIKNLFRHAFMAIVITATTLSVSAAAEDNADLSDVTFEMISAYLADEGYTSIRMIAGNPFRCSAFDRQRSEVHLDMDPKTGLIASSEYAHWMDQ